MAQLRIERVNSLPATLQPSTLYYVKGSGDLVDLYMTGTDAGELRHLITKPEIQGLINQAISTFSSFLVVQDISARDALTLSGSCLVLVLDATSDPTVNQGSALYAWDAASSVWYKVAEYESLDLVLDWNNIQGRPNATPLAIDTAVVKAHNHSNAATLDQLGNTGGELTYAGQRVANKLDSTEW